MCDKEVPEMKERQSVCQKPQDPKQCTAEQVRACHGDAPSHDCETTGCERKPETCSPEQIRECHGEVAEHPCVKN